MPKKVFNSVAVDDDEQPADGAAEVAEGEDSPPKKYILVEEEVKLDEDQQRGKLIHEVVIPQLVAYKTLIRMKNIKHGRKALLDKEIEKLLDQGCDFMMATQKANGTWKEPEPEEVPVEEVKPGTKGALFGIAAEKAAEEAARKK